MKTKYAWKLSLLYPLQADKKSVYIRQTRVIRVPVFYLCSSVLICG